MGKRQVAKWVFSSGLAEQEGAQGCPEMALGGIWDDFGEHFGAVHLAKAARKEGRKRGETLAEREREREMQTTKVRRNDIFHALLSPAFHCKLLSSSLSFRRFPVLFVTTGRIAQQALWLRSGPKCPPP